MIHPPEYYSDGSIISHAPSGWKYKRGKIDKKAVPLAFSSELRYNGIVKFY